MSKPARGVIGIIRLKETSRVGVDLPAALDDSTLGSLLAGLVGKPSGQRGGCGRSRFERAAPPLPCACFRRMAGNLHRLRDDLEREYARLVTG